MEKNELLMAELELVQDEPRVLVVDRQCTRSIES